MAGEDNPGYEVVETPDWLRPLMHGRQREIVGKININGIEAPHARYILPQDRLTGSLGGNEPRSNLRVERQQRTT